MLWCASIARHCYGLHGRWLSCATAQGGALSSAQFQTVGSTHVELLLQGSRRAAAAAAAAGCGGADPGAREAVREARQACAATTCLRRLATTLDLRIWTTRSTFFIGTLSNALQGRR